MTWTGFFLPWSFGLAGLVASLLARWADPSDDTIAGGFRRVFVHHSLTVFLDAVLYTAALVYLQESMEPGDSIRMGECFFLGYCVQDLVPRILALVRAGRGLNENGGQKGGTP